MEAAIAHTIAFESHVGQRNRFGDPMIDHVERVAAAVPRYARATALLHDVLERSPGLEQRLHGHGLTQAEEEALRLLTHAASESYTAYIRRIADARGRAGRLARIVKLADLDDHLAHAAIPPGAPPYAWARARLLRGSGGPPSRSG